MNTTNFNTEAHQQWENKAEFWDQLHGDEGNDFHRMLVSPSTHELLNIQPGEVVLDLACGNGVFTRELLARGAIVVAADFSVELLKLAEERTTSSNVTFQQVDATDEADLLTLGARKFDAIVCNMALQDIDDIAPLFRSARELLKENGRFVFTVPHPCFNTGSTVMVAEREDVDGELVTSFALKVIDYLNNQPERGLGAIGEPNPHWYFDRPIHALLAPAFAAGLAVDGLLEKATPEDAAPTQLFSRFQFRNFPLLLSVRLRAMPTS